MEVFRMVVTAIDFDGIGADGIKAAIEQARYPNRCISPAVRLIESRDIGEWSDNHPLNFTPTDAEEIDRLFSAEATP